MAKGLTGGLRKAKCVRMKMADGKTKTQARRACGVKVDKQGRLVK